MATFAEIAAQMSDSGAKADKAISEALSALPIRIVLEMTPKEAAQYVQNFHDAKRQVYLQATR